MMLVGGHVLMLASDHTELMNQLAVQQAELMQAHADLAAARHEAEQLRERLRDCERMPPGSGQPDPGGLY